jgi:peptidoglycan/LPS O-acetylase OafA/YrhL
MKTQHILGILWFALFSFILIFWLWQFMEKTSPESGYFRVLTSPVFLFGAIASFFLFRGAQWARIAIGIIALLIAVLVTWLFLKSGWRWPDGSLGVFALASVVLLFLPRHDPVA